MNKIILIFAFLFLSICSSYASQGDFVKHVLSAYNINTERLPVYSELSNSLSEKISYKLLFMESILLPIAKLMDLQADYFQQKGIPFLQVEIVPMDLPPFKKQTEKASHFIPLDILKINDDLTESLNADDFINFSKKTEKYLTLLEKENGAHCLMRHFLESIRRSANYAPSHIEEAKKLNITSPKKLIILNTI